MILATGATGNIGRSLLKKLRAFGAEPIRVLTRDTGGAAFVAGVEAVEGDPADISSLSAALDGVRSMFLVPRFGPDAEIIDLARRADVEHVVLVSSITVETHPHLGPASVSARQQVATIAGLLNRDIEFTEITREDARSGMVAVFGEDAADAVLDVTGGDVDDALLRVRDTVPRLTGSVARTFAQWAEENVDAFR